MIDWPFVLRAALINGLILSLALTMLVTAAGSVVIDMFVDKYPAEIRARYGPMSPRAARLRPFIAAVLLAITALVPLFGLVALQTHVTPLSFSAAFAFGSISLLTWNTFDLIVLDWLFFCTVRPRSMTLPGTAGMAAYRDYRFHFVGFLKGLGFCAVGGLLIAVLWVVLPLA